MRSRLLRFVCLALPTAAAVLVAGPAAAAAPVDYVALGDSYSSGVGAAPYDPFSGFCLRSPRAYAPMWARSHEVSSFRFVACGGATTDDVRNNQLWALNAATDLVTITIGGNDVGFANTVITCQLHSDAACLQAIAGGRQAADTTLPAKLNGLYAAIRQRAPGARVVVMGYPRLLEPGGSCGFGMSQAKRQALADGADHLASLISGRARAAGFTYIDTRSSFAGHGICAGTPWINDFLVAGIAESFHPNRSGYASGYLPALRNVIG